MTLLPNVQFRFRRNFDHKQKKCLGVGGRYIAEQMYSAECLVTRYNGSVLTDTEY